MRRNTPLASSISGCFGLLCRKVTCVLKHLHAIRISHAYLCTACMKGPSVLEKKLKFPGKPAWSDQHSPFTGKFAEMIYAVSSDRQKGPSALFPSSRPNLNRVNLNPSLSSCYVSMSIHIQFQRQRLSDLYKEHNISSSRSNECLGHLQKYAIRQRRSLTKTAISREISCVCK